MRERRRKRKAIGPWWLHITHWRDHQERRPKARWALGGQQWLVVELAPHYVLYARIGFWRSAGDDLLSREHLFGGLS